MARTFAGRLLLVANLAAANVAAFVVVIASDRPSFVGTVHSPGGDAPRELSVPFETGTAWTIFLASGALLALNVLWLVRRPQQPPQINWVVSETPSGPVRIAREAIEAGLQKAGENLPEITRLRVQVDTHANKRIPILGQFHCAEGANNLAASQRLRDVMLARFGDMVRPADGGRVELVLEFQGFVGRLGKKAAEVPPPREEPFTGPRYPIDDDGAGGHA
jgi:hypothetical protein